MSLATGSLAYRRFAVLGTAHPTIPEILAAIQEHLLKPGEFGCTEEVEYGWGGPLHLFDNQITSENCAFDEAVIFALRIDVNKCPADLKKAYQMMEERAVAQANPSGFISRQQKKGVKDVVRQRAEEEVKSGKHRKSRAIPILWDVENRNLYAQVTGDAFAQLAEIFERSFRLELQPMTAGAMALDYLSTSAERRTYEDLRPSRFVLGPEGENQFPEYPWIAKGPEPKDFLGNEFLLWLLHNDAVNGSAELKVAGGATLDVFAEKSIDLECAFGRSGKETLRGDAPSKTPEARAGLREGKVPRKAFLNVAFGGEVYRFNLSAETFALGAVKLPDLEDMQTERDRIQQRIGQVAALTSALWLMFQSFMGLRADATAWEKERAAIERWIQSPSR